MMSKLTTIVGAMVVVLSLGAYAPADNIVVNGGFESGNFSGWTHSGDLRWTVVYDSSGYKWWALPHSGNYRAILGPYDLGTLAQDLSTTAGHSYTLTFWIANDLPPWKVSYAYGDYFSVLWNGSKLLDIWEPLPFSWTQFTFKVPAGGPESTLAFGFSNYQGYFYLDDVSLVDDGSGPPVHISPLKIGVPPVPEPASIVLTGSGLLALLGTLRRRR